MKENIIRNNQFVLLDASSKHFILLKNEDEVQRYLENNELGENDIVVELTKDNMRVAIKHNFIELK